VRARVSVTGAGLDGVTSARVRAPGVPWRPALVVRQPRPPPPAAAAEPAPAPARPAWAPPWALRAWGPPGARAGGAPGLAPRAGEPAGERALVVEAELPAAVVRALGAAAGPGGGGRGGAAGPGLDLLLRSDFRTARARAAARPPAAWLLPARGAGASRAALAALTAAASRAASGAPAPPGAEREVARAEGARPGEGPGASRACFPSALVDGVRWVDLAGGAGAPAPLAAAALVALLLAGGAPEGAGAARRGPAPAAGCGRGWLARLRAPSGGAVPAWRALAEAGGEGARALGARAARRLAALRHRAAWRALCALDAPAALVVLADPPPRRAAGWAAPAGGPGGDVPSGDLGELRQAAAAARRAGVRVLVAATAAEAGALAAQLGAEPVTAEGLRAGSTEGAAALQAAVFRAIRPEELARL